MVKHCCTDWSDAVCRLQLMLLTWKTVRKRKRKSKRSACRKALVSHTSSSTALITARQLFYAPSRQENCPLLRRWVFACCFVCFFT